MPELPEVETIANRLNSVLKSKSFQRITVNHPRSFSGDISQILFLPITHVSRRAKIIRIHFLDFELHIHLKMTGQLIYKDNLIKLGGGHPTSDWIEQLPGKHTRVIFDLGAGQKLFFNDQRVFGWIKQVSNHDIQTTFSKFGPDINHVDFSLAEFSDRLAKTARPIKVAILDQSLMAGIGNIYACDGLHLAKISPFKPARTLTKNQLSKLYTSLRQVINRGIELGGTTFDGSFKHIDGLSGSYQNELRVYGLEGSDCQVCGKKIVKAKLAGRGTYYCPSCQPK